MRLHLGKLLQVTRKCCEVCVSTSTEEWEVSSGFCLKTTAEGYRTSTNWTHRRQGLECSRPNGQGPDKASEELLGFRTPETGGFSSSPSRWIPRVFRFGSKRVPFASAMCSIEADQTVKNLTRQLGHTHTQLPCCWFLVWSQV